LVVVGGEARKRQGGRGLGRRWTGGRSHGRARSTSSGEGDTECHSIGAWNTRGVLRLEFEQAPRVFSSPGARPVARDWASPVGCGSRQRYVAPNPTASSTVCDDRRCVRSAATRTSVRQKFSPSLGVDQPDRFVDERL